MAGTIVIKNGYVFDPLNEIKGEIMDIFVQDGKVVTELPAAELKTGTVINAFRNDCHARGSRLTFSRCRLKG